MKNEVYFSFSEAQPVLSKSKTNLFDFAFPNRSLSYQKIVQGERRLLIANVSKRKIAKLCKVDRNTLDRYIKQFLSE